MEGTGRVYHGNDKVAPSQISLLTKGASYYNALCSSEPSIVVKKNSKNDNELYLRKDLVLDLSQNYVARRDINVGDLERMFKNKRALVSGRQLLSIATRGAAFFRKAVIFALHKWDPVMMSPKKSGTTLDDVIYYVRCQMWKEKLSGRETKETALMEAEEDDKYFSRSMANREKNENDDVTEKYKSNDINSDDNDKNSKDNEKETDEYCYSPVAMSIVFSL